MNKKIFILQLLFTLLLFSFLKPLHAQQSRVDSVTQLLHKSNEKNTIDTAVFEAAFELITKTTLNDSVISVLETTGSQLKRDADHYFGYRVRYAIMMNLSSADKYKAIEYGKYQIAQLEKSDAKKDMVIKSNFFKQLRLPYRNSEKLEEGFKYFTEKLKEYKLRNDSAGLADCYIVLGGFYRTTGLLDQAVYNMKKSLTYMNPTAEKDIAYDKSYISGFFVHPTGLLAWSSSNGGIGKNLLSKGEYKESVKYSKIACDYYSTHTKGVGISDNLNWLALAKILSNDFDSVAAYLAIAEKDAVATKQNDRLVYGIQVQALYKIKMGDLIEAERLLLKCWQLIRKLKLPVNPRAGILEPDFYLAMIRMQQNKFTEAIELLKKDITHLERNLRLELLRDYKLLGELYEKIGDDNACKKAYKSFISLQDSLLTDQKKYSSVSFETEQEMNAKELSITKLQSEYKLSSITRNFTIGIAALLLILAATVYYRFKTKQKANKVLEKTIANLKSTQTQLIQSEKMASLGELTAGIAHEIQNPLNFVNNFSEVNKELAEELEQELDKGNYIDAKTIAKDIKDNEEKINHHGKRADAIVKGMLQHSRSSSGVKEPTDINALCDEYLRLSYHGLRARDKSFNATIKTDFDTSLEKINIIPQDIGRAILNLLTNAFYAVNEKKQNPHLLQRSPSDLKGGNKPYEPTVTVSTRRLGSPSELAPNSFRGDAGKVEIRVSDNGNGIPQNVLDKIFQPFFTTKPTGQGTGLGLSMSYDIVKAHGGELKVKTKEARPDGPVGRGEGSEFTILLPV